MEPDAGRNRARVIGLNSIWPMSIMYRAFTTAGKGFMHESFNKDNPSKFARSWFAWANTLLGELMMTQADEKPALLAAPLS
jgi:meiotically up-regulated gene 157 (Mug157) protein